MNELTSRLILNRQKTLNDHTYKFFSHAHNAWDAIYEACEKARVEILLEHYIFIDDQSGRPLIDILKRKAKEGVKVKMLLDAFGSMQAFPFPLETELKEAGIEIEFFNTLIPYTLRYFTSLFFRDHRKIIVIDSSIAFTGGVCFEENMRNWRDTCVQIEGPVVQDMERSFTNMWKRAKKMWRKGERRARLDENTTFAFLTNEPFPRRRFLYYELLEQIKKARKYIRLTTPYFVPNRKLLRALARAARRGIEVSLLVPRDSDRSLVDLAAKSHFTKLLKAGVNIYQGGEPFNHTKAGTIDGEWGTLGSLNLDYVSLRYNFEANLITNDSGFISALNEQFAGDCEKAELLQESTWRKRPFYKKLLETCVRPFCFLL